MFEDKESKLSEITYLCKADCSKQPALIWKATGDEPRPLLVGLHTWSATYTIGYKNYESFCIENNWNFIFPQFRGPNWNVDACGSEYVVSDIEDAVAFMNSICDIDQERVYLCGGSGGGHCTLLMAGRRPDLFTAVSAWCPISDVNMWYLQCLNTPHKEYSEHIVKACGGVPSENSEAFRSGHMRSPLTWLPNACCADVAIDISTGVHDGHTGSVPVSQAINAFNVLAKEKDRLSQEEIDYICKNEKIPEKILAKKGDPAFGEHTVYFRRQSNNARLTLFEGGHDLVPYPALTWLARQRRGKKTDWKPGKEQKNSTANTELWK